jgi:hypothetical protein
MICLSTTCKYLWILVRLVRRVKLQDSPSQATNGSQKQRIIPIWAFPEYTALAAVTIVDPVSLGQRYCTAFLVQEILQLTMG